MGATQESPRPATSNEMAQRNAITVTFGNQVYKFKSTSSPGAVLDHMAKMHPPRGCLKHVNDEGMVALSQEEELSQEELSQEEYTYHHGQSDGMDSSILNAVLRLEVSKNRVLETIGTAVVCSKEGLCLTANHCLEGMQRSAQNLIVGGHEVKVLAQDDKKDIAVLQISEANSAHQFLQLDGTIPIIKQMQVHLISYPFMVDEEFGNLGATITHGEVVNRWSPNLAGADYACFSNSSGGAVVHDNKLIGIHLESIYEDKAERKGKKDILSKLRYLESNESSKGNLGNFLNAAAIANFLDEHNLVSMPNFRGSSSRQAQPQMPSSLGEERTSLGEEKTAIVKALKAESKGAAELRALNADLSRKLEATTQQLELVVAQRMADGSSTSELPASRNAAAALDYVDEGDEVVDRVFNWIVQLFPSRNSRRNGVKRL